MRMQLSTWSHRVVSWGPWTAVIGTFLLIGGLIWDVSIHEGEPSLAAHESVFTIDNPAHVVFLTGIALIVVGMGLFLIAELRLMRAQRRGPWAGVVAVLAVAFLVLATAGAAAAVQTQLIAASTTGTAGHVHGATPGASGAPAAHHATFVTTGPGCTAESTPPTAAQQAAAVQLTAQVKAAWSSSLTPTQAVALGYRAPVTTPANPTLVHYVDPTLVKDTTDLMDPARPQALVFLHLPDGTTVLGGVLFTAPIGSGPCPGGALTLWHYHQAGAVREMIHVWLYDNPTGAFATGTGGKAGLLVAQRELETPPTPTAAPQN
jgi:hypothetical protein